MKNDPHPSRRHSCALWNEGHGRCPLLSRLLVLVVVDLGEFRVDHVILRSVLGRIAFGLLLVHGLAQLHRSLRQRVGLGLDRLGIVALQRFLQVADGILDAAASAFSVECTSASAWFLASTASRRFLSAAALASASLTIFSMSASDRPPEAWMRICCSLPVAFSLAETLTMPLASISKVTSICGMPRGEGGMPIRSN